MIDKSLSQYYDSKYNIENRRRYFTGAYGGGGGKSGGNGSADRGGRAHQAAAEKAQEAARDASADRGGQAQKAAAEKAQKAARDTAREKAIEVAAKTEKTNAPTRSPHKDTPTQKKEQAEIDLGTLEKARTAPITLPKKYKTVPTHVPHSDDTVSTEIRDFYSPTGYQDLGRALTGTMGERTWGERARKDVYGSGIMSKIGGGIKKIGKTIFGDNPLEIALNIATMGGFKGAKYAKMAHDIKKGKGIYGKIGKTAGLDKTLTNLTSNLKSNIQKGADLRSRPKGMPEHLGERGFRTTETSREGEGDNIVQQVAGDKDVISESIKKYTLTDDQKTEANRRRSMVQEILNQGAYQGNELTAQQRDQLTNYIAQIDRYLVDPTQYIAQGGRIDSPLTGGSRYI